MRKLSFIIFLSLFTFLSCDDGDIIIVDFDFDYTYESCGELVFYNIESDPYESLSLQITSPALTLEDLLEVGEDNTLVTTIDISSSNPFNYRSYNADPDDFFCNDVPPSDVTIISDLESTSGVATITTILTEDDNDGIPADVEDENLDGDNDPSTNPTDTDGDGIPDYLDDDDDGDNIKTSSESPNYIDGEGFVNSLDTDADGIPDYLDDDDDGDGVLTRDEENKSQDQNPANDITFSSVGADYLNPEVANTVPATAYRQHTIEQSYEVSTILTNIQLPGVSQDIFNLGTLDDSSTQDERYVTPEF
ncbi:conserved hypothetical protein [Formosa agariphila KMM 3901]|uniref:Lipoprotein n=1 Tax=Formosa agariphila (strain DSM 15362 / KCTC 12365 / LMG 23005 / KMM 3901 / M-2Alg 35-1) TaxID=1347342 RepID=T2KK50_FORAG|nr:hypothetical protein [Formosa agariphila]CDF79145.1 conserved hypothetical protein [Formosa agariphila KMM 3901]